MINKPFSKIFDNYKEVAEQLKIDLNLRPSELSCNDYYRLTEYYEKTKMIWNCSFLLLLRFSII